MRLSRQMFRIETIGSTYIVSMEHDLDKHTHMFSEHATELCISFFEKLYHASAAFNLRKSMKAYQRHGEPAFVERRKKLLEVDYRGILERQVFGAGATKSQELTGGENVGITYSTWAQHIDEYEDRHEFSFIDGLRMAYESWQEVAEEDWTTEPLKSAQVTIVQPKSKIHILFKMLQCAAADVVYPYPWIFMDTPCVDTDRVEETFGSLRKSLMKGLVLACVVLPKDLPEPAKRTAIDTLTRAMMLPRTYAKHKRDDDRADSSSSSASSVSIAGSLSDHEDREDREEREYHEDREVDAESNVNDDASSGSAWQDGESYVSDDDDQTSYASDARDESDDVWSRRSESESDENDRNDENDRVGNDTDRKKDDIRDAIISMSSRKDRKDRRNRKPNTVLRLKDRLRHGDIPDSPHTRIRIRKPQRT